jgi:hypothetical protein
MPVIETLRGLLVHGHVGASWRQALAWCGGILAGPAMLSIPAFCRRSG